MNIQKDKSLLEYNTLKVNAFTDFFCKIESESDLYELYQTDVFKANKKLILGGGSNLLFTKDFTGLTIHSSIDIIELIEENKHNVRVKVGSGVEWDNFVDFCVQRNWGGIENLSDIPGRVGAAPVQNIGAYGVEAKDSILSVIAFNLENGEKKIFSNTECNFGYRSSIFKQNDFKKYFISHVIFQLSKKPVLKTSYGIIEEELKKHKELNIQALRNIIIEIRQSKLPSVEKIASAGSFFKNPVIEETLAQKIKSDFPDMPEYNAGKNLSKIPAAWLIEKSGLKGYSNGKVGTYQLQPLVIINNGQATGKDIVEFSQLIQSSVKAKFNIYLEPEVCFI